MNTSNENCPVSFLCGKGTFYISIAVLVLFVLNCVIISLNRAAQNDIVAIQQDLTAKNTKVQQNQVFTNIYQSLVQALATVAVTKKDEQIKNLLIENNIKFTPGKTPAGAGAAAPSAPPAPSAQ